MALALTAAYGHAWPIAILAGAVALYLVVRIVVECGAGMNSLLRALGRHKKEATAGVEAVSAGG